MNDRTLFRCLAIVALLWAAARADTQLLTPDTVVASSQNAELPSVNLINGSGIVGYQGQTAVALDSVHSSARAEGWESSANDLQPTLQYTWREPEDLCGLVIWQSVGVTGVKEFTVTASDAAGEKLGSWTFLADEEEPIPGTLQDVPARFFPMGSDELPVKGVTRVVVELRSNHGGDVFALGETHFARPSDEPSQGEFCVVTRRTPSKWIVPRDEKNQSLWFLPDFIDRDWRDGAACLGYEVGPLCDDLIVYLTMDAARVNASTAFDTSGSPVVHDGQRLGTTTLVGGQVEEALEFPGNTQSFVGIPHHPELNPETKGYSVGMWVHPEDAKALLGYLAYKGSLEKGPSWIVLANAEASQVVLRTNNGSAVTVGMPGLPAGEWSHIGFVIDRKNNRVTGFLNGIPRMTAAIPEGETIVNENPVMLLNTLAVADVKYRAALDDFAIWKRALTPEEMSDVHKAGAAGQSFKTSGGGEGLYNPLIETNVGSEMYGVNASIWERIRFNLNSTADLVGMDLKIHYDDGFVCYLNGVEVARRNVPATAPTPPSFNEQAAGPRPDVDALTAEVINLDSFVGLLRIGGNVLAIHGLNERKDADRFVICPELCLEKKDCRGRNNGTDFWVTFPENAPAEAGNPKEISLCITGIRGTKGRVEMPRLGITIPFTLNAQGEAKVWLNPALAELTEIDMVMDNGVHITAERPVSVVGLNHINFSTDGFLALPTPMLGTEHRVLAYPNVWVDLPQLNGTQFGLVATVDKTVVQITPSVDTNGRPAGVPYYIKLDEGQTYQLMNLEDGKADLSGTLIRANQPVALFAGHRCANVNSTGVFFCDHLVEQIPPIRHWRSASVVGPLATRLNGDTVRVLAAVNGTEVRFNGVVQGVINAGEVLEKVFVGPTVVTTNGPPVLVAQYSNSSDFDSIEDADPFMALATTIDSFANAYRICSPPTGGFDKNFLNLVVPAAGVGATTVDGVSIAAIPGASFTPIPVGGLIHAIVPVSTSHPHDVVGPQPFSVLAYGFASYDFDSYGYPAGISYPRTAPQVTAPLEQTTYASASTGTASTPNIAGSSAVRDDCDPVGSVPRTQTPPPDGRLEPGVYVVTVSATNSGKLTGTATTLLRVLPTWQAAHFPDAYPDPKLEATVWGWSADPDEDEWDNESERVFGGDPNDPSSVPTMALSMGPEGEGGLRLSYRRLIDGAAASYSEQGSNDMVRWLSGADVTTTISRETVFPGAEYEEVVIEARQTTGPTRPQRYFLRVMGDVAPE